MKQYEFHPLALEYRRMSEPELDRMADGMRENGFDKRFPIVLYLAMILDGCNRQIAAIRAGVEPTYTTFVGTEEQAAAFVDMANERRRHLTEKEQAERRKARVERVAKSRTTGKSQRTIAKEEGVSAATVNADIKAATVQGLTVDPPDGKVTGKDGRIRTVAPAATVQGLTVVSDDESGETIEEQIETKNNAIEAFCRKLMKLVKDECPEDEWLTHNGRKNGALRKFSDGCDSLRAAKCTARCPACKGEGCQPCQHSGRVPKYALDQMAG